MKLTITNMLLLVTIVALGIALAISLLAKDPFITLRNEDGIFSFNFRQELLRESPRWSESEENPPLSVRGAMEIADQICDKLNAESNSSKVGNWGFDTLTLTHLNFGYRDFRIKNTSTKWCYLVHFETLRSMNSSSFAQSREEASFIILMDGTILVGENAWSNGELEKKMREHYATNGR